MPSTARSIARSATLVCDIGALGFLRVLDADSRFISVETRVRGPFRIARIDRHTGDIDLLRSPLPLLNLNLCSFSGESWANASNKKSPSRRTLITWQNSLGGFCHSIAVDGEWTLGTYCASAARKVFVATRRSTEDGGGRILCCRDSEILWHYESAECLDLPSFTTGIRRIVRAYPTRAACLDDGSSVAFSFFNFLYILGANGELLASFSMAELCSELFQRDFSQQLSSESHEVVSEDDIAVEFSIGTYTDGAELPLVKQIVPLSPSNVFLVSYRNALIWITSSGKVAHAIQLSLGAAHGIGDTGSICHIEASEDGRVIIAHVGCCGVCVIIDGKEYSTFHERADDWHQCALDKQNNLIAIHSRRTEKIGLYDLSCNALAQIPTQNSIRDLIIPGRSQLLFVIGETTQLFDLR